MKKEQWEITRSVERRYRTAIERLFKGLRAELAGLSNPFSVAAAIRRFARSPTFRRAAYEVARSMVTHVAAHNQRTWRKAARVGGKGRAIFNALAKELSNTQLYHRIIQSNAEYIQSMPEKVAQQVTKLAARGYEAGKRPAVIAEEIFREYPYMTRRHARLIARTETSKASTALTRARCDYAKVSWYVWRTSDDERVRSSHRHMEGVIIPWNEPPSPEKLDPRHRQRPYGEYHAGDTFNCRCYPQPLLEFDDVTFPHRVYYQGKIQMMTLAKFKAINGGSL